MNPRIDYLKSLSTLAAEIYPDIRGVKKLRYNARFCLWGILMPDTLARIQDLLNQPSFHPVRQHYPRTLEKPLKPYVCVKWPPQERAQRLIEHFAFLEKRHAQLLPLIYRHQAGRCFNTSCFRFSSATAQSAKVHLLWSCSVKITNPCSRSRSISVVVTSL